MTIEHVQVTTTAASKEEADALARSLVESRLGACAQVHGPISSIYRWNGEVHVDEEWGCIVKTTSSLVPKVLEHVADLHPYDNPELAVLPIVGGTEEYLDWISSEVGDASLESGA